MGICIAQLGGVIQPHESNGRCCPHASEQDDNQFVETTGVMKAPQQEFRCPLFKTCISEAGVMEYFEHALGLSRCMPKIHHSTMKFCNLQLADQHVMERDTPGTMRWTHDPIRSQHRSHSLNKQQPHTSPLHLLESQMSLFPSYKSLLHTP